MAVAPGPEVLEFRVPTEPCKTLLVWGLENEEEHSLYSVFSEFGLLYSVRVHRNASVAEPGYYALVKFYSARDASRAQQACSSQQLFQKSPLKVYVCTRQKAFQQQVLSLNSYKCQELANYYLGFNGWSSRIFTLQNLSGFEKEGNEVPGGLPKSQCLKYLCAQEVMLPHHGICTRGIGVAEVSVENNQVTQTRSVMKLAVQRALSDAFQKILLVILENGKVAVEYSSAQEDPFDSLTEEEMKGLIQVSDSPLEQLNQDGRCRRIPV
uniref:RAD52 motif-containing protein 1 n=1 Tax=Sphenodon punctatus TaxID=8508 RepID=A0A8D0H3Y8_SPHPU